MNINPQLRPPWRLPRIRQSGRALMFLILVFGCWLGWYVRRVQIQREAVAAIKRAGGSVACDWEWGNYNPDIIHDHGRPRDDESESSRPLIAAVNFFRRESEAGLQIWSASL